MLGLGDRAKAGTLLDTAEAAAKASEDAELKQRLQRLRAQLRG